MEFINSKRFISLLWFLVLVNCLAWTAVFFSLKNDLEVTFFDIGQGDAILIQTPQGKTVLIDGGPDTLVLEKLGKAMPFWDRSIDLVVLTHPHYDHYRGLLDVLESYEIGHVVWTGVDVGPGTFDGWSHAIQRNGIDTVIAHAGIEFRLERMPDCTIPHPDDCLLVLEVLHPLEDLEGQVPEHIDNTSVVTQLRVDEVSFLFTGDLFWQGEYDLIEQYGTIPSTVLKVGHHGSSTSTSTPFLYATHPEVAVIQAGRNNLHGHPHTDTIERLEQFNTMLFRTDIHGDVTVRTDGTRMFVSSQY